MSVQWHRHLIGRWLVPGIAIKRGKDRGGGVNNIEAFHSMIAHLGEGERLLYFPEGTSRLGTERLPVRRGTLILLEQLRATGAKSAVFFAAAHYHEPTRWRSAVSLGWIGPLSLPPSPDQDESWVRGNLLQAQTAAYAMPTPAPRRFTWLGALAALPYLPIWATTSWLARRVADEENVIALWKFLFGVPATFMGLGAYTILAIRLGLPWWKSSLFAGRRMVSMDAIAQNIRRGLVWVALPLALASALRLSIEPQYWSGRYLCWLLLIPSYVVVQALVLCQAGHGESGCHCSSISPQSPSATR